MNAFIGNNFFFGTYRFITGMSKLYNNWRRSSSCLIVGMSFLSPADVPEL
jgi:hypothetical protein